MTIEWDVNMIFMNRNSSKVRRDFHFSNILMLTCIHVLHSVVFLAFVLFTVSREVFLSLRVADQWQSWRVIAARQYESVGCR